MSNKSKMILKSGTIKRLCAFWINLVCWFRLTKIEIWKMGFLTYIGFLKLLVWIKNLKF